MNQATLFGRLCKDPELAYKDGRPRTTFTLAVDRPKSEADFILCKAFGPTAENIKKFVRKGDQVCLSGSIKTGSYEKNGHKVYYTEIWVGLIDFASTPQRKSREEMIEEAEPIIDGYSQAEDDIPF